MQHWRQKSRSSTLSIKQCEWAHILTHNKLCLPERPRKNFQGTNCGDTLTDVKVPHRDSVWSLPWKQKKELYGKKHLIAVGGKTVGAEPNDSGQVVKRTDTTVEPVIFHPTCAEVYDTLISDFFVKTTFDLVCTDDVFAFTSLKNRTGYIGICFTQAHKDLLETRLLERLGADMADAASPLYNVSYALAMGTKPETATPAPAKKRKAEPAKPKKKSTKKKKATTDDGNENGQVISDESDLFSGDDEGDDDDVWDPLK